ncbi:MAG TPA: hypothetical protein VK157_02075 [Phycisphaerales bacterium]|nr:hypothetical protein [Phycisphaerales bacterium]
MTRLEPKHTFRDEGQQIIHTLRRALTVVYDSVGANPAEPQEVSRRFGLDKMLTWRLSRLVCDEDIWEAMAHMPRRPSLQIFCTAMQKAGVDKPLVNEVINAYNAFEHFVDAHAGDRGVLEIMASGATRKPAAKRLEQFRREGFLANAAIWGVSARVHIAFRAMYPSTERPGFVDLVTVVGLVDFKRLRANVSWAAGGHGRWRTTPGGNTQMTHPSRALDAGVKAGEVPLLREFCSQPLPEMHIRRDDPDNDFFMINPGPVGNTAAATVLLGWVDPVAAPMHGDVPNDTGEHGSRISTPAELFIHDLYIHESLQFAHDVNGFVFGQLPGGPRYPHGATDDTALPLGTEVMDLGVSPPAMTTPEMPRYEQLVRYALARVNSKPEDFRGYRMKLRYPPIPSMSLLRHPLLPPLK